MKQILEAMILKSADSFSLIRLGGITHNWSPYAYVLNNPMLYNDPLGLDTLKRNEDGSFPTQRPDGSSLQEDDIIVGQNGNIYFNGESWQPQKTLAEVTVSNKPVNEGTTTTTTASTKPTTKPSTQPPTTPAGADPAEVLVIPTSRWKTQIPNMTACFKVSQAMAGYTAPKGHAIFVSQERGNAMHATTDFNRGIQTIESYIAARRPIVIGVNHTFGRKYNEGTTDHFIVIAGAGYENGVRYYRFYDPGTAHATRGASAGNRLYLRSDAVTGTSSINPKKTYTLSQVRPN